MRKRNFSFGREPTKLVVGRLRRPNPHPTWFDRGLMSRPNKGPCSRKSFPSPADRQKKKGGSSGISVCLPWQRHPARPITLPTLQPPGWLSLAPFVALRGLQKPSRRPPRPRHSFREPRHPTLSKPRRSTKTRPAIRGCAARRIRPAVAAARSKHSVEARQGRGGRASDELRRSLIISTKAGGGCSRASGDAGMSCGFPRDCVAFLPARSGQVADGLARRSPCDATQSLQGAGFGRAAFEHGLARTGEAAAAAFATVSKPCMRRHTRGGR